jgi:glycosyltransferase involved in cell wall biosynthesis
MVDRVPLISVVAICYNHERFLVQCLESVRAQTYPAVDLVIVDDCSTDRSVPEIRTWMDNGRSKATFLIHDRNLGICRSRNDALERARGEFVSFISTDDWWLPDKLAHQMAAFHRCSDAAVVYADALQTDEAGSPLPQTVLESAERGFVRPPQGRIFDELLVGQFIPPGPLVRRSCLDDVGAYDESLAYEDWDMWLRLAERFDFAFAPELDVVKRDLSTSLWKSLTSTYKASDLRILLKHVEARPELWHRIAVLAYETNDPNARTYYKARLRRGFSWRVSRFYVQSLLGLSSRRALWLKRHLTARRQVHPRARAADGTPSTT